MSRDLSFNLFPVGSHSLGHVICLLIYFRLAAMLLNILKCISMFILLPLTINWIMFKCFIHIKWRGRRGRDGMVVGSTTICDKVCQLLATGRWFSPGPPASSTNITDRHDITEILLNIFNEVQ